MQSQKKTRIHLWRNGIGAVYLGGLLDTLLIYSPSAQGGTFVAWCIIRGFSTTVWVVRFVGEF